MTIEDIYSDFSLIKKMKAPFQCKSKMLTFLLAQHNNPWRVVGVTINALSRFKDHNFERHSGMRINRSHIKDRNELHKELLENGFEDYTKWWQHYYMSDKTVLATSTENKTGNLSKIINIDENRGLFKSKGFAWTHGREEQEFLKHLYESTNSYT